MTTDTRTEAERRYDAERDGSLYLPSPKRPNPYDTGERAWAWTEVKTPIATLAGFTVMGRYDTDGSHHCISIENEDGMVFADKDGLLSGVWAEQEFEIDAAQIAALCHLFASGVLPQLLPIAAAWEDRIARRYDTHAEARAHQDDELDVADWIDRQAGAA